MINSSIVSILLVGFASVSDPEVVAYSLALHQVVSKKLQKRILGVFHKVERGIQSKRSW